MSNMSRIRNTIRFQTPEERVLNALLIVVVLALATVGVFKLRDDDASAAARSPRVATTRARLPLTGGTERATTTTAPTTTTTTLPAELVLRYTQAVLALQQATGTKPTPTTTAARPTGAVPPPSAPAGGGGTPTTSPTTRPPTTTTTRPVPTTTTTRPTTTTTTTANAPGPLTP